MKKLLLILMSCAIAVNLLGLESFNGTTLVGDEKFQMKDISIPNLELGKNYKITFDLTKNSGVKSGYVSVFKYLDAKQQEIYGKKLLVLGSYGEKNPSDGKTYNGTIIIKIAETTNMNKGVRLALYNRNGATGSEISINNLKISEVTNAEDLKLNLAPVEALNSITLTGGGAKKFLAKNYNVTSLKPNTNYILSVNIKKTGDPKQASISLLYKDENDKLVPILNRVGQKTPCDGKAHHFEQKFTTPEDISRGVKLYFYNNYTDGEVTFSQISITER